ncbi:MAG TPA: acyclic terpene utilization AtuA family protein [Acidimicrobiales bacterium]|nr:acyclic terpene utilization AtuA family protein [Acidimicrobiales bacterium]
MTEPIRIANCSGFFGDRLSAAKEMVDGGPIDVLTGDWLAELTMLILARTQLKHPGSGYARTFLTQMEQVMGACLDRSIKVVSNAGGLDPAACAEAIAQVANTLGLVPTIAYVNGDDLLPRVGELSASGHLLDFDSNEAINDLSSFITANAYLGCFGIAEALSMGADIVITGRVTDAALVCGPAAWHHDWRRDNFDALAGAVVAGHAVECGAQVTGGNYSFFDEIPSMERIGFPWVDVFEDGSSIVGKHDGTGGEVSIGTVTSQLLYEIASPSYYGPDVTARFDTITLEQVEQDRVRMSGVHGEAPPATLKVAMNKIGGYRKDLVVALTGLDIEQKARLVETAFWRACPFQPDEYDSVTTKLLRTDKADSPTNEESVALWRLTLKDRDERKVGRIVADALVELALATVPGFFIPGSPPSAGTPFGVYRPARVPSNLVPQYITVLGGERTVIDSVAPTRAVHVVANEGSRAAAPSGSTTLAPLGDVCGARSGDKGGDANLGVFTRSDEAFAWLDGYLSVAELRRLLPETAEFEIDRYRLPALRALNFVIHDLLDEGVAASTRQDAQAKGLGEWLRSRYVDVPTALLAQ